MEERKDLNFEEKKEELIRFLDSRDNRHMALATSRDDIVQARMILVASEGLDIYFFTWKHSRKFKQIEKNQRVALCKETIQIEGTAEILGDLSDKRIGKFTDIMKRKYPDAIKRWEQRPGMVLLRIKPVLAVNGASSNGGSYIDYLDLANQKAYSEKWANY
ncbi:MAG: pyridoxamine 5'-phosphate oxidase family protein [Candidatus Bathyarchaeia archaeon]|jgi:general stress protein 26